MIGYINIEDMLRDSLALVSNMLNTIPLLNDDLYIVKQMTEIRKFKLNKISNK